MYYLSYSKINPFIRYNSISNSRFLNNTLVNINLDSICILQVSLLQDTTQSRTIPFNNTLVNIKPDTTLPVFSGICLTRYNSITNYSVQQYVSQYQTGYDSVSILRYLSYKIQLNQELHVAKKFLAYIYLPRYTLGLSCFATRGR